MLLARICLPCIAFGTLSLTVVGVPLSSRVAVRSEANIEFLQTAEAGLTGHADIATYTACPRDTLEASWRVDDTQKERLQELASTIRLGSAGSHLRIGCALKTSRLSRQRSLDAIQTWGRKCDAMYVFSDEEWTLPGNLGVTTIPLRQENNDYKHLWQKTQMMFGNLSRKFWDRDQLDFIVMADDDAFFIMENLRTFLASEPIQARQKAGKPIMFGDLWENPNYYAATMKAWVNGGGYVINRVVADEVSKCTSHLSQENVIPEDVMVCSCMVRSDWQVDPYQESNGCDSAGRKMFSQESILTVWGKNATSMSPDLIEFHHAVGEQRYHFFRSLYKDDSPRLCVEVSPSELYDLQNGIRNDRRSRQLADREFKRTLHDGEWKEIPPESLLSMFGINHKGIDCQPVSCIAVPQEESDLQREANSRENLRKGVGGRDKSAPSFVARQRARSSRHGHRERTPPRRALARRDEAATPK
jgi:predicted transcriptional regulator